MEKDNGLSLVTEKNFESNLVVTVGDIWFSKGFELHSGNTRIVTTGGVKVSTLLYADWNVVVTGGYLLRAEMGMSATNVVFDHAYVDIKGKDGIANVMAGTGLYAESVSLKNGSSVTIVGGKGADAAANGGGGGTGGFGVDCFLGGFLIEDGCVGNIYGGDAGKGGRGSDGSGIGNSANGKKGGRGGDGGVGVRYGTVFANNAQSGFVIRGGKGGEGGDGGKGNWLGSDGAKGDKGSDGLAYAR